MGVLKETEIETEQRCRVIFGREGEDGMVYMQDDTGGTKMIVRVLIYR